MREMNPWVKGLLDFGPLLAFFLAYGRIGGQEFVIGGQSYSGLIVLAVAFAALTALTTAITWAVSGRVGAAQVITLVIVVAMAGFSALLQDERWFKMKPTLIEALFAAILFFGLARGKSYLRLVLGEALELTPEGWMILTRRYAFFFAAMALANEIVWRNFSTDLWVKFKVFGLMGLMVAFTIAQAGLIARHGAEPADENGKPK